MPTTTPLIIECPICLDKFRDPVVTPCGHLACHPCIKTHARGSGDPYKALCPTCRAPFPTVTPDLSIVPKIYHVFISPPLRRVFFEVEESNLARKEMMKLKAEVTSLNALVTSLRRDKDLLMDRCDAAQWAVTRLTADERAARLARDKAREDARVAKQNLKKLQRENDARNCRCAGEQSSRLATLAKRTSGHASLDDSTSDDSTSSSGWSDVTTIKCLDVVRSIKPMPKRAKLGPARAAAAASEPNVQQSSGNATSRTPFSADSSSSESESESSPEPPRELRSGRRVRRISTNPRIIFYDPSSGDDEADNRDERGNMEDFHAARLLPSPIRNTRDAPFLPSVFPRGPRRSSRLRRVRESGSTSEIPSESTIVPDV